MAPVDLLFSTPPRYLELLQLPGLRLQLPPQEGPDALHLGPGHAERLHVPVALQEEVPEDLVAGIRRIAG